MKNQKLLLATSAMVAGLGLSALLYSCSDYKTDESNVSKNTSDQSSFLSQNPPEFEVGEAITFESRYDLTTKIRLEVEKIASDEYNVKKWVSTISANDPLEHKTLIIGAEIVSSADNLIITLPEGKQFRQVPFDPNINDPTAIQLGKYDYTCHCCADTDNGHCCADTDNGGSLPTGFGMCKVAWGYIKGALLVNCLAESCISGCGMESKEVKTGGNGGYAEKKVDYMILDATKINVTLMQE